MLVLLGACGVDSTRRTDVEPCHPPRHRAQSRAFAYPSTQRVDHVDTYHGTQHRRSVSLAGRPPTASTCKRWIQAQNALAQPYLEAIPARERIKQRMTQLWNYERYDIPVKRGNRYFYLRNDGLQNQSVLYITDRLDGEPRVLLDPNKLSKDATVALGEFVPSPDGRMLAYSLSDGGTDWRTWHFWMWRPARNCPTSCASSSSCRWRGPRIPRPFTTRAFRRRPTAAATTPNNAKSTGTSSAPSSRAISSMFKVTDHPTRNPYVQISDDGRYAVFWLYDGSQSTGIYYRRIARRRRAASARRCD